MKIRRKIAEYEPPMIRQGNTRFEPDVPQPRLFVERAEDVKCKTVNVRDDKVPRYDDFIGKKLDVKG